MRGRQGWRGFWPGTALAAAAVLSLCGPAAADKIRNKTAVFSGLDKITGRIIAFEAAMDETVQFGSLKVTTRSCLTRPATETPQTVSFAEVDEVQAGKDDKRIFSGWMFAASPGLHGIEHPIYDIWLTGCKNPGETIPDAPVTADAGDAAAPPSPTAAPDAAAVKPPPAAPKPKKPKPPVVARTQPQGEPAREPTQRFFPASQYPTDLVRDPSGNSNR